MKNFIKKNSNIIITIFFLFIMFLLIYSIIGRSIIKSSIYNSYELQARAWLDGRTYLDHNYPYLELAIYNGKYFVSFPPLPSVVILPFVIIFQNNIPTNLIAFTIFAMQLLVVYKILKRYKNNDAIAITLACAVTIGTNMFSLAFDSGVWFIAQLINNLLCFLAIDFFLKDKKALTYLFLALAVGCRPFSAVYMVMFFVYYLIKEKDVKFYKRLLNNIKPLIPAMIVAIIYMIYNYIRFDNILEFGHNYLPEFTREVDGQFSINYLFPNLKALFFNRINIGDRLTLNFEMPFSFLIANPIILVFFYRCIKTIVKKEKVNVLRYLIVVAILINIILICLHRTLGGWQFGARYTCDFVPFVLLGIIISKDNKVNKLIKLDKFEIMCIIFGILLNVFGAIWLYII